LPAWCPAWRLEEFVGIKSSIQRWALIAQVRQANALIRGYCDTDGRLAFIDVDGPMLGWGATPRPDLFAADGLHLSPKGYALWTTLVAPFVEQVPDPMGRGTGSDATARRPGAPDRD
jgi:lysophospholipase L1-like esterase